jgi:hypothetical protein
LRTITVEQAPVIVSSLPYKPLTLGDLELLSVLSTTGFMRISVRGFNKNDLVRSGSAFGSG